MRDFSMRHANSAGRIAGKAPLSMQLAKEQLNMAAERTFDAALTAMKG